MSELKKQTISGVKWLVGSSFLQKAIQMTGTIVLARILSPAEFGLFALAFVATDALGLFKSMGFDSALIQRKDEVDKAANTAFFIIPLLGILLYLILTASAPWIGNFLNNAQIAGVIRTLGIIFMISCFGKVPAALLEKHMQFKQVSIIEIGTALIYSVSAVTFALLKFGVWSLVFAYILKALYQNTLTFIYARWRPRLEFDKKIAKEMFHFGKFLFLGGIVWFLRMNLDNILVGKILGVAMLGLYAIAFNVSNIGADYLGNKVYRVIFPAYSKIRHDIFDLQNATTKVLKYLNIIALPLCIGFFLLSREFLFLVYGSKWLDASNALRILSWSGYFSTIGAGLGPIFNACGKPKLSFIAIALQVAAFVIFIAPAAKLFGIAGVSVVVTLSCLITFLVTFIWAMKLISIKMNKLFCDIQASVISTICMALVILVLKKIFLLHKVDLLNVYCTIILILTAVVTYSLVLILMDRSIFKNIKEHLIYKSPKHIRKAENE